jgi:hypothetical protein
MSTLMPVAGGRSAYSATARAIAGSPGVFRALPVVMRATALATASLLFLGVTAAVVLTVRTPDDNDPAHTVAAGAVVDEAMPQTGAPVLPGAPPSPETASVIPGTVAGPATPVVAPAPPAPRPPVPGARTAAPATTAAPRPAAPAAPATPAICDRRCARRPGQLRVLTLGDSLMDDVATAVGKRLTPTGVQVHTRWVAGTGLVTGDPEFAQSPGEFSWLKEMRKLIDEHDPDVVLVEFMGVYFAREGGPEYMSAQFQAGWARAAEEAMRILTARRATVYWILAPPMYPAPWNEGTPMVNGIHRGLHGRWTATQERDAVQYIDSALSLAAPDGSFASHLPNDDGVPEQVREDDGVHLTAAGVRRLTEQAMTALRGYSRDQFRVG